jgi:hypothetical protein
MRKPDLSKLHLTGGGSSVPTMIVPPGTQIQVDREGQVSIRTPGNLVLQNSGAYSVLESVSGSIRIEPSVHVDAVTVRCAETCLVQGTLTAWRVVARMLHVDNDAEAHVVMQETEKLELGKNGRLVGNFRSEKELFELFSRYAGNLRALPEPIPVAEHEPIETEMVHAEVDAKPTAASSNGKPTVAAPAEPVAAADVVHPGEEPALDDDEDEDADAAVPGTDLPDPLALALLLLEAEASARPASGAARRSQEQLLRLLRTGDIDTLRQTYKTLFARLAGGSAAVKRARQAVGGFFDAEIEGA